MGFFDAAGTDDFLRRTIGIAFVFEAPDAFWFPEAKKDEHGDHGSCAGGDVDQIAVHIVGPEELHSGEGNADNENGGKNFPGFFPADHGANQPKRNENGGERKDAAKHDVEVVFGERGDYGEGVNGCADGAPGDGSGVGDEIERGGVEWIEAKADHEGSGDGDGSAEAGGAFDECAETEGD